MRVSFFFFFFSSRRRHTRCSRDWSSDVCSSDLLAANFMVLHPRCFNLSDMGVGKTLATLWAVDWLMKQYPKDTFRALVVCPLSIMQRVWGDAIFKNFLSNRSYKVLHGDAAQRIQPPAAPAD